MIDMAGLDEALDGVADDFRNVNWLPFGDQELGVLQDKLKANFERTVSPDIQPWAKLAPGSAARRKVNKQNPGQILVDTGALKRSVTEDGAGIRAVVSEPGQGGYSLGTDIPYSVYHDKGTSRMPARRHLGTNAHDLEAVVGRALDYVIAELKRGAN